MGRDTGSFPCSPENSVLAFTCSGTDSQNSPLCSFLPATNGNLLLPEIEDLEKGAFMRCPVSVVAFGSVALCCSWLVWLGSRLSSCRGPSSRGPCCLLPYLSTLGLAPGSRLPAIPCLYLGALATGSYGTKRDPRSRAFAWEFVSAYWDHGTVLGMSEGGKMCFRAPSSNSELRAQRLAPCDTASCHCHVPPYLMEPCPSTG